MSNTNGALEWWIVLVRDWGSVAILGNEKQAEDFRVHKSRWEYRPAWKVRLRDATAVEADEYMVLRDAESGIVDAWAISLPNDVREARDASTRDALLAYANGGSR